MFPPGRRPIPGDIVAKVRRERGPVPQSRVTTRSDVESGCGLRLNMGRKKIGDKRKKAQTFGISVSYETKELLYRLGGGKNPGKVVEKLVGLVDVIALATAFRVLDEKLQDSPEDGAVPDRTVAGEDGADAG